MQKRFVQRGEQALHVEVKCRVASTYSFKSCSLNDVSLKGAKIILCARRKAELESVASECTTAGGESVCVLVSLSIYLSLSLFLSVCVCVCVCVFLSLSL